MKKYIYLIATMFLLGGCTLSMEDWVTPEEDRGKDEPYTVESEYGTITYQFADSVLYVTDKVQEDYIVRVEHDSILYFNGNVPEKFRPYVGMKLATGCSHLLPYGLNHKVISVEDVGGILKVVATKISTDEVYEHLSYCIDADVVTADLEGMSEEELLDYGYELTVNENGDTIIMDWNEYDVDKGLRPAAAKRRSLKHFTRGDDIEEENSEEGAKDDAKDGTKKSEFINFSVDTRGVEDFVNSGTALSLFKFEAREQLYQLVKKAQAKRTGKLLNKGFYAATFLQVINYSRAHAEEDKDRGYELKYTDSWSEWVVRAELGYSAKVAPPAKQDYYFWRNLVGTPNPDLIDGLKDAISSKSLPRNGWDFGVHTNKKWNNAQIRIIVTTTPVPIAFIATASLEPTIELNGCLSASFTYTSAKRRVGFVVKGKGHDKENLDYEVEKGKFVDPSICGNGSIKMGMKFRAAAGIEVAAALGVTCGFNVETYLEGKITADLGEALTSGSLGWKDLSGNIRFYCDLYGDIQLHVAPLGIKLWDKQVAKFGTVHLINWSYNYGPKVYFCSGKARYGEDLIDNNDMDLVMIHGYYQYKDLDGIQSMLNIRKYYPAMKLYFGPISDNNWIYMQPVKDTGEKLAGEDWKEVEEGKTYFFDWIGVLKDKEKETTITEAYLVPALCTFEYYKPEENQGKGQMIENLYTDFFDFIEVQDKACLLEMGDPVITTEEAGQIEGKWDDDFDFAGHEQQAYIDPEGKDKGGQSVYEKQMLRDYTVYTTVNVQNGTQMREWGLKIYVFGPDGDKRLIRRKLVVNKLRTGIYTFIFHFRSNWGTKTSIDTKNQHLYFRIQPYWSDPRASGEIEAQDKASLKKYPIDWEMEDTKSEEIKNKRNNGKWGTVDEKDMHNI